jgi:hypothetical protein
MSVYLIGVPHRHILHRRVLYGRVHNKIEVLRLPIQPRLSCNDSLQDRLLLFNRAQNDQGLQQESSC